MQARCTRCSTFGVIVFQNRRGMSLCQDCHDLEIRELRYRRQTAGVAAVARRYPREVKLATGSRIWLTGDVVPGMPITIGGRRYIVALPRRASSEV